jgi:hypothetical protein
MDWIEKLFGVSPDGGNGSAEVAIIALLVIGIVSGLGALFRRRHGRIHYTSTTPRRSSHAPTPTSR